MKRICITCSMEKEISEFRKKGKGKSGQQTWETRCVTCDRKKDIQKQRALGVLPRVYLTEEERRDRALINKKARKQAIRKFITEYKKSLSCLDCNLSFAEFPFLCDFHHLDPTKKDFALSKLTGVSLELIKLEIEKCAPLCANCHRKRHFA